MPAAHRPPYFPGWAAAIDGRAAEVVSIDYALSGVLVPAGEHEVTLSVPFALVPVGSDGEPGHRVGLPKIQPGQKPDKREIPICLNAWFP